MYRLAKAHAYGLGDPSSTPPSASSLVFLQPLLSRLRARQSWQEQSLSQWSCYTLHAKIKYLLVLMVLCVPAPTWVPRSLHCKTPSGAISVQCKVQNETTPRGEVAKAFQCCATVCKDNTVSWGRGAVMNLLVQRKAGQNWVFLHSEYVPSLRLCGVPLCGNFSSLGAVQRTTKIAQEAWACRQHFKSFVLASSPGNFGEIQLIRRAGNKWRDAGVKGSNTL